MMTDICFGDSGSPVWIKQGGKRVLVAIVVRVRSESGLYCGGSGSYVVLVTNDEVREWIRIVIHYG